ncbi:DUF7091 family protein [Haloparvum sedimenti]|uniref:DUF7091 family protein n=1 Tax=Haloparvum sedimenti TaxID=1678448 RepID=UPI00071E7746|nr:hypothetical protein [Haloparvum sedimenti]
MDDRLGRVIRQQLRKAGRQFEEAKRAYAEGQEGGEGPPDRSGADRYDLPADAAGDARIVCRRHAEKRTVAVGADGRPECFEAGHPDCEGCAEDVRDGYVETW